MGLWPVLPRLIHSQILCRCGEVFIKYQGSPWWIAKSDWLHVSPAKLDWSGVAHANAIKHKCPQCYWNSHTLNACKPFTLGHPPKRMLACPQPQYAAATTLSGIQAAQYLLILNLFCQFRGMRWAFSLDECGNRNAHLFLDIRSFAKVVPQNQNGRGHSELTLQALRREYLYLKTW